MQYKKVFKFKYEFACLIYVCSCTTVHNVNIWEMFYAPLWVFKILEMFYAHLWVFKILEMFYAPLWVFKMETWEVSSGLFLSKALTFGKRIATAYTSEFSSIMLNVYF